MEGSRQFWLFVRTATSDETSVIPCSSLGHSLGPGTSASSVICITATNVRRTYEPSRGMTCPLGFQRGIVRDVARCSHRIRSTFRNKTSSFAGYVDSGRFDSGSPGGSLSGTKGAGNTMRSSQRKSTPKVRDGRVRRRTNAARRIRSRENAFYLVFKLV